MTSDLLIDLRNCSIHLSRPVLDKISLRIAPFEHTAIVGPNGSGKSTLIRMLMREIYPSRLDGEEPVSLFKGREAWSQAELRQEVSLVSIKLADALLQVPWLDVYDAIASSFFGSYGFFDPDDLSPEMRAQIGHVMTALHLDELRDRPVRELSTGQLRKVLIARAMVLRPSLILLDEPSLGLDIVAQSDFLRYIGKAAEAATILMVTHHLEEILPVIKNVLLMKDGKVFAFGPKETVLTKSNLSGLFDAPLEIKISRDGIYSLHRV